MDLLSEDGVSFDNAFCQNPVCVPTRCSFMTELYPHTNGHRTMTNLLKDGEDNLLIDMKKLGYHTIASSTIPGGGYKQMTADDIWVVLKNCF